MADGANNSSNEKSSRIITKENLSEVLRKDKGSDAIFKSFMIEDFTAKGDNYSCYVTSIKVDYMMKGISSTVKYVAKVNPQNTGKKEFTRTQFMQENKFYAEILPEINEILLENNQEVIRVPKFYHFSAEAGSEILFFEDMRERGFKLFDRFKGVDERQANLVFNELGRLHAAGKLMVERYGEQQAIAKFRLLEAAMTLQEDKDLLSAWFGSLLITGSKLIGNLGHRYQRAAQVLVEMRPNLDKIFDDLYQPKNPFATIQHGDWWNNNILFRYENGEAVEVCLLDLQMSRYSSVGIDLNYFAYTSFHGAVRKQFLDKFLDVYYSAYSACLPAGHKGHFTKQQLRVEYEAKKLYGLIMTLIVLPLIMSEGDMSFDDINEQNITEKLKEYEENRIISMAKNPNFEPRFVDKVEEMIEAGILV